MGHAWNACETPMTKRFVLIDRDGTLNVERHYLSDPDQLELTTGAGPALRRLKERGLGVVVVTNQSGIARGKFDLATLDRIHDRLRAMLADEGVELDGVYFCPHGPEDGCGCRKPLPGMALQAAVDLGFDPARSFMIGDKPADIDLGRAVGATTFLVRTGHGDGHARAGDCQPDHVVDDLAAAARIIERSLT